MNRLSPLLALPLTACGPAVLLDTGATESETGSPSSSGEGSPGGSVGTLTTTSAEPTTPPPTNDPSRAVVSTTVGEATSIDEADVPPIPTECWQVETMFEAPEDARVFMADQDQDGRAEVWVTDNAGGLGESTSIFALDASGTLLADHEFSGFVLGLGDVEGDGLLELTVIAFGGGPTFAYVPSDGAFSFEVAALSFDILFTPGVSGFFDITQDGRLDAFQLQADGQLDLLAGDGAGGLALIGSLPLRPLESMVATKVENSEDQAVVWSVAGFSGGELPCWPTSYHLVGTGMGLANLGQTPDDASDTGGLHRARVTDRGRTEIFADVCDPKGAVHDVRLISASAADPATLDTSVLVAAKPWATVFDHDGNGVLDPVYADGPNEGVIVLARDALGNSVEVATELVLGTIEGNNVRAGDMDGDGREELIVGTTVDEGSTTRRYERIFLGPC